MPKLTWRSAWEWSKPIAEGGTMEVCLLGQIEVGRVQKVGAQGAWICWLPTGNGSTLSFWKYERSWLAARAALSGRVHAFIAATGLVCPEAAPTPPPQPEHPADDPPTAPATQPDLFGETHV